MFLKWIPGGINYLTGDRRKKYIKTVFRTMFVGLVAALLLLMHILSNNKNNSIVFGVVIFLFVLEFLYEIVKGENYWQLIKKEEAAKQSEKEQQ